MVKIQVKRNENLPAERETKKYECLVIDKSERRIWEIETPRKFTLLVANTNDQERCDFLEWKSTKKINDDDSRLKNIPSIIQIVSLWEDTFVAYDNNTMKMICYYHPIRAKMLFTSENAFESISITISVDIINFALEYDDKKMMLTYMEHLSTKSMFIEDLRKDVPVICKTLDSSNVTK